MLEISVIKTYSVMYVNEVNVINKSQWTVVFKRLSYIYGIRDVIVP